MESKRHILWSWIEQGDISRDKASQALSVTGILPDSQSWESFIEKLFLWLGVLAICLSVMFFMAYNWDQMGRFSKFAIVEALIMLCLLAYWRYVNKQVAAQLTLMAASILLGILLALYGQTYQTGADPWQLFASWALLILPWVLLARFPALWIMWIVLLNLSLLLYSATFFRVFGLVFRSDLDMFWLLFLLNTLAWAGWELSSNRFKWLQERWAVRVLAVASGTAITTLMMNNIFSSHIDSLSPVAAYLIWITALIAVYQFVRVDLFMLAGACLSVSCVITALFVNALFNSHSWLGSMFTLTLVVLGLATGSAFWLKRVQQRMRT